MNKFDVGDKVYVIKPNGGSRKENTTYTIDTFIEDHGQYFYKVREINGVYYREERFELCDINTIKDINAKDICDIIAGE